ncbi:MAG: phosphopyruvate hydratase [Candidatus Anstonellaceae archaeon]
MTRIKKIEGLEVLDSRANPTLMARVELENKIVEKAYAPSGASRGKNEAIELRDGGKRLSGLGVKKAIENIKKIEKILKGQNIFEQQEIDFKMIELDGTANMANLGANATVAVSLACFRAGARAKGIQPYYYLNKNATTLPVPFMNIINGGAHAGNKLAIQEFMIVPKNFKKFEDALWSAVEIYHILKNKIKQKYGKEAINLGDEGGFAPPLQKSEEALELISSSIEEGGYNKKIFLALDAAANSFFDPKSNKYNIDQKQIGAEELLEYYLNLLERYKIISIEDPFEEMSYYYYAELKRKIKKFGCYVVADDMTVSNLKLVKKAIAQNALDVLLLKVNQIGTLSQAIETAKYCIKNNIEIMVSHRSGETEDSTIADIAVGLESKMIKTGAPARGERTAKYNRLLEICYMLKNKAKLSKI